MKSSRLLSSTLALGVAVAILAAPAGAQDSATMHVTIHVPDSVAHVTDREVPSHARFAIVSRDGQAALVLMDTTIVAQMTDRGLARINASLIRLYLSPKSRASFTAMDVQLLAVPYDSGNHRARMGAGPEALLEAGLERALQEKGHRVHTKVAELPDGSWHAEIQTSFELMRMVSSAVREARESGRLPIVLAGNCNTAVGTLAGLGAGVGVAWFDAHGDFNTPETTTSGFLDGTAVAIITGRCWTQLAATVPEFEPVPDDRVCLIGTRDIDPLEGVLLDESGVDVIEPGKLRSDLAHTLASIRQRVQKMYVHLDLDVLDAKVAAANNFAVSGGLTLDDVEYALSQIAQHFRIAGVTLSAYDPDADIDGAAANAAIRMICTAAGLAGGT